METYAGKQNKNVHPKIASGALTASCMCMHVHASLCMDPNNVPLLRVQQVKLA